MPKNSHEYLIDTDVLEEHLTHNSQSGESYLELLMQKGICFSTVLNASELLCKASSESEERVIIDLLSALKILGLHSRYSLLVPKYRSKVKGLNRSLICVVADYNKLPIITLRKSKYQKSGLRNHHPKEIVR